jgi:hypothetical protein
VLSHHGHESSVGSDLRSPRSREDIIDGAPEGSHEQILIRRILAAIMDPSALIDVRYLVPALPIPAAALPRCSFRAANLILDDDNSTDYHVQKTCERIHPPQPLSPILPTTRYPHQLAGQGQYCGRVFWHVKVNHRGIVLLLCFNTVHELVAFAWWFALSLLPPT